ncbi:MAG: helix-turn-helix domain-containing protein [Vulcanimicrobiaceae bacterium]
MSATATTGTAADIMAATMLAPSTTFRILSTLSADRCLRIACDILRYPE